MSGPQKLPLRWSRLALIGRSPAHCRFALDQDLAGIETSDTASQRFGRLAHAIVLDQPLPAVFEGERRIGKAWDAFVEAHPGRDIVKRSDMDAAQALAASIMHNLEAAKLLRGEFIERTLEAEVSGRVCRATPDSFTPGDWNTELKTTTDAQAFRFAYQARRLGYFGQMGMQHEVIRAAGIKPPAAHFIVAAETKPPYEICVFQLSERAVEFGVKHFRGLLEQFRAFEDADYWPGYVKAVLDAPDDLEALDSDQEVDEEAE